MKFKFTIASCCYNKRLYKVIMRAFLFLFCSATFAFSPSKGFSQNARIKINSDRIICIEEIFELIKKQTKYEFIYDVNTILDAPTVTVKKGVIKAKKLLKMGLKPINSTYEFSNNTIIVKSEKKDILPMDNKIQTVSIEGKVSDAKGPLPGASIVVKGTSKGAQTDFDGNYVLTDVPEDAVLVFSYVGFVTQEINVSGQTKIDVVLVEDSSQLAEVVVVGYISQTRGDLTGSVATVDVEEATKNPVVNAAELLQGRASGVSVVSNGRPGEVPKINIRGFGTVNNTDPLFIIDGVQTDDAGVFNSINPSDIKQLNVLKDAAAAIYGARAANGVVIVTTKSGGYNQDKAKVSVDYYTGISEVANLPDLLNIEQHKNVIFRSLQNSGASITHPQYDPNGTGTFTTPSTLFGLIRNGTTTVPNGGTKWLEEITRNAQTQNLSISVENGGESGKYFMSAAYLNREGVLLGTGFKRGVVRLNSEFKAGRNRKLTFGKHLSTSFSRQAGLSAAGETVNRAMQVSPLLPVFDNNGLYVGPNSNSTGLSNTPNPVATLERAKDNYVKRLRVFGDIYGIVDVAEGLKFKSILSGSIEQVDTRQFFALDPESAEPRSVNLLRERDENGYSWTWTNTLSYNKIIGDHSINALVGVEAVEESIRLKVVSNTDYLFETPDFYTLFNGAGSPQVDSALGNTSSLFSVFGTANYSYKSKYLATLTVRNDKSSRFKDDNQSDIFPSLSAGWVVSNEDFFPENNWVNYLKLSASYGEIGNQTLSVANPTSNISVFDSNFANYAINGSSVLIGALLSSVGNPDLKWETSKSTNVGLDLGLFENALSIGVEYFNIETEDLITLDETAIPTTGPDASPPFVNVGSVTNKGVDFTIAYNNQTESGFAYGISANLSTYKNEIVDLIAPFQVGLGSFRGGAITRSQIGRSISEFYGRVVDGVFASESEVASAADQGFSNNAEGVGRLRYRDLNGDNVIDDEDRTFIGSPHPDFTYGINLNASYKSFDVSVFFQGSQGNDIYNYERIFTDFPTFFNANQSTRVLNAFDPVTNPNSNIPALRSNIVNNETAPNSYFIEDGSYLRLKNLQLGYTLPESILDKVGIGSLRIYLQGTNLFTITDYNGLDPELRGFDDTQEDTNGGNLTLGVDFQTFPLSRLFSMGLNIKF
ncbi:SusC/RagA family TonB-linked outer membrane protein [Aquimarina sediminis]|uniref:SusC/RagA family TonB-linked outer membrane protein n=1 Tax=Aquimarina sediminis TaxID=2070536 RepID=UPI001F4E021C|nr:TonB-dependent receptor [Aquimarina sediminis]